MSAVADHGPVAARPAPVRRMSAAERVRLMLFPNPTQSAVSIVLLLMAAWLLPRLVDWAVLDAVFFADDASACAAPSAGACWAVVSEKYRVMFFGTFPFAAHWRPALAIVLIFAGWGFSAWPRMWSWRIIAVWAVLLPAVLWLMLGGAGLAEVSTGDWGGLPLTLILFTGTVVLGLPLSLLLALGRTSSMPAFRFVCIGIIEIFRGLPLLVVLFLASLLLPLFLGDVTIDKVVRALAGMTLFFSAYAAEIVRGGLQALPKGQFEGARALGLSYWPMMATVILPQALRIVLPALVNDIVRAFKNTSFVAVIGLFDFLGATKAALEDPGWVRYALEAYLFLIVVYFIICSAMSWYALWIEGRLDVSRRATLTEKLP